MSIHIKFIDREFNRAINELAGSSRRSDVEVLTGQAIQLTRAVVRHTRLAAEEKKHKGRARAGWWIAWQALGVFGTPWGTNSRVLAEAEGGIIDRRRVLNNPSVEIYNTVPYIETLDNADDIVQAAATERFFDMQRAIERRYAQNLRRKSAFA